MSGLEPDDPIGWLSGNNRSEGQSFSKSDITKSAAAETNGSTRETTLAPAARPSKNKIKGLFLIQTERQRFGRDTMSAGRYCSGSGDMSDIHAQPNSMSYPKSKCKNQLGRLETCEFISSILSFDTKFKTETGNFIVDKIK